MDKYLPILAIETSGKLCSVAVLQNPNTYACNSLRSKHIHSEKLIQMIDNAVNGLNISIDDIRLVAVSNGPGSFTGLRIGMSSAKGIGFAKEIEIVAVPTFQSFALQIASMLPTGQKFIIVNNVNVDELYYACFEANKDRYLMIENVSLIKKADFKDLYSDDFLIFGNYTNLEMKIKHVLPDALFVAKWAYLFGKDLVNSKYDLLEPNYLKNFVVKDKK